MKTLKVHSEIGGDGVLRLEVATGLSPGPAEVTVLVEPEVSRPASAKARSGLFVDNRAEAVEVDAAIKEQNARWQGKLEDLPS